MDRNQYLEQLAEACNNDIRFTERNWQEKPSSIQAITQRPEFLKYLKDIGRTAEIKSYVSAVYRVRLYNRSKSRLKLSPELRHKLQQLQRELRATKAELKQQSVEYADELEPLLAEVVKLCLAKPKKRVFYVGVDCLFIQFFDHQLHSRIREIRNKFMSRDTPFKSKEEAYHWIDDLYAFPSSGIPSRRPPSWGGGNWVPGENQQRIEENLQRSNEFDGELEKLAQDYNFDSASILNHILMGDFLRPLTHKIRLESTGNGRPYLDLRIYHPQSLILLNRDLFTSKRLSNYKAKLSAPRIPKRKPMLLTTRLRTWFIYFLSRLSGGPISQDQALQRWNNRFKEYRVSLRQYQRQRNCLLSETCFRVRHSP